MTHGAQEVIHSDWPIGHFRPTSGGFTDDLATTDATSGQGHRSLPTLGSCWSPDRGREFEVAGECGFKRLGVALG